MSQLQRWSQHMDLVSLSNRHPMTPFSKFPLSIFVVWPKILNLHTPFSHPLSYIKSFSTTHPCFSAGIYRKVQRNIWKSYLCPQKQKPRALDEHKANWMVPLQNQIKNQQKASKWSVRKLWAFRFIDRKELMFDSKDGNGEITMYFNWRILYSNASINQPFRRLAIWEEWEETPYHLWLVLDVDEVHQALEVLLKLDWTSQRKIWKVDNWSLNENLFRH